MSYNPLENAVSHVRADKELVTIYLLNGFGAVSKYEGKLVELYSNVRYAQYNDAVKYSFIQKRKRNACGYYLGYKPWIVVVAGHGHPDPEDMYGAPEAGVGGVQVRRSLYGCFDQAMRDNFERDILPKIPEDKIIYKRFK